MRELELTFALIKPHILKNKYALEQIKKIITEEFEVVESREIVLSKNMAETFYFEHRSKFFYRRLLTFMCSGPSLALILASENSITKWRSLMGPTKVYKAIYTNPESIRGEYGLTDTRNACHGIQAKVHNRPKNLALDNTTSIAAVSEFLEHTPYINAIALIQCTSVFLKIWHLQQAYELFQTSDCVFSVTRSHKLRWILDGETKYMKSLNFNPNLRPRRQDWEGELIETGMFYFAKRELIERNVFQNERCRVVEVPERDALEIDTRYDLNLARCILNTEKYYD